MPDIPVKNRISLVFLCKFELDYARRSRVMGETSPRKSEHGSSNFRIIRNCRSVKKIQVFGIIPKWPFFTALPPLEFWFGLTKFSKFSLVLLAFSCSPGGKIFSAASGFPLFAISKPLSGVMDTNQAHHQSRPASLNLLITTVFRHVCLARCSLLEMRPLLRPTRGVTATVWACSI